MPRSFAARTASKARPAASAPASRAMKSVPLRVAQILSCSIAAARNVSPAANITERPSARNLAANLPMVVVLPEPLTPATRMTNGFFVVSMTSGCATCYQRLLDLGRDHRLDLVGRDRGVMTASAQRVRDPVRGADAEIGPNQRIVDFLDRRLVEHALGDEIRDRGQRRRAALEAAGKAPPPRLLGFGGFSRPRSIDCLAEFLACGARDSRFAKVGKHGSGRDGVAAPLSRRADAGGRQAGRHGRAPRRAEQQGQGPGIARGPLRYAALWVAAPPGAGAPARPRYIRLPHSRPPSQGAGAARQAVSQRCDRQDLLGRRRRRPGCRRRRNRHAARPPRRQYRLVAEARSARPAGADPVESDGARTGPDLARARTADRTHPSAAGALRGDGLAHSGRCRVRQCAAARRPAASSTRPRNHGAALQEPRAHSRRRAGAGAFARASGAVRLARRGSPDAVIARPARSVPDTINKSSA